MNVNPPPEPSWRKPAGIGLILLLIAIWAALILAASPIIEQWHVALQTIVYLLAGIAWLAPMRPLLLWMETGKWRE